VDAWILRFTKRPEWFDTTPVVVLYCTPEGEESELEILQVGLGQLSVRDLVWGEIEKGHRRLILDLMAVDKLDSTGIGEIVRAYVSTRGTDAEVVVADLSDKVRMVFELTKIDQVVPNFASIVTALTHFDS